MQKAHPWGLELGAIQTANGEKKSIVLLKCEAYSHTHTHTKRLEWENLPFYLGSNQQWLIVPNAHSIGGINTWHCTSSQLLVTGDVIDHKG